MLIFTFFSGINEAYEISSPPKPSTNKSRTKTSSSHAKSTKFSIGTVLNKKGSASSKIGSSLEKAGFKLVYKKNSKDSFDDGESFVKTIEKKYEKNGITVEYAYIKDSAGVTYISIEFPNYASKKEFINSIRLFFNKNKIKSFWMENTIEFIPDFGYGQISLEGLTIDIIWI